MNFPLFSSDLRGFFFPVLLYTGNFFCATGLQKKAGENRKIFSGETVKEARIFCFQSAHQNVRRGRCPHRPGGMQLFYGDFRRIRNIYGRCGHRPLRVLWQLSTATVHLGASPCRAPHGKGRWHLRSKCRWGWGARFRVLADSTESPLSASLTSRSAHPVCALGALYSKGRLGGYAYIGNCPTAG